MLFVSVVIADDVVGGCFVPGECIFSAYLREWPTPDPQECLELCQELDGCDFFTHYGNGDYCTGFADCIELSEQSCVECYSGNSTCPGCSNDLMYIPRSSSVAQQ